MTKMELSNHDMERLEKIGYDRFKFAGLDRGGILRLRNDQGYCVFYDIRKCICRAYMSKPLGCYIYPVIYRIGKGIVVDDLCPMKNTVSNGELKRKGKELANLMQRLSEESKMSTSFHQLG